MRTKGKKNKPNGKKIKKKKKLMENAGKRKKSTATKENDRK